MFSKLLKYEWRANRGLLAILTLATFGIGILATAALRVLVNYSEQWLEGENLIAQLSVISMVAILFVGVLALCIYAVAVQIILLYRFYKNKFTDEGYLTFTLPVKTTQIYWSSFLNMLIWLAISVLTVFVVIALTCLIGTATEGFINTNIITGLQDIFKVLGMFDWSQIFVNVTPGYTVYGILYVIQILVTPFYGLMVPMACITTGAVLAKKHKILASFGIYYAVNFVFGILTSMASLLPSFFFMLGSSSDGGAYMATITGIQLFFTLGLAVGSYCLTIGLMKRKLNLP